jgi:adenosylcobinamide-phosphate synthase
VRAAALIAGFGADLLVGDPRRRHPVAAFGAAAAWLERRMYAPSRARGALFAGALVAASAAGAEALARRLPRPAVLAAVTWGTLGGRSLRREAHALARLLAAGDMDGARRALPSLCGRDPAALGPDGLARAAVESVAENTADAVVGALVWGALGGPAGAAAYRAANTLDAMVGHRSERYTAFGWAAARLDDVLGWPGARLGAALACVAAPVAGGSPARAWGTLRRDGHAHPSPNAGRMEAAFAGALGLRLGGPLSYGGHAEERPALGGGRPPQARDIERANRLSLAVGVLALAVIVAAGGAVR